jgi:ABC-type polysaccharide/polyol phosphate export permease
MACFIHLINMPLVFTSNVLVPSRQMPDWLAQLSSYNPLTQVVSPVREALLKGEIPSNGCFALIVLSVSALILFSVATHALSGCRQE